MAVHGEFLFLGILRHDAVEVRRTAVALGAQYAAQSLGFFLAASERSRNLDEHVRVGQVDGEVANLRDHQVLLAAVAEGGVQAFAFLVRSLACDERNLQVFGEGLELVDVLPDNQHAVVGLVEMLEQALHDVRLFGVRRGERNLLADGREGVLHLEFRFHRDTNLVTVGSGNPALRFQDAPRDVVLLGADKAEDLRFLVVFAHERRCKAKTAGRLHFGTQAEHRGGQQVHLVVNHEAPLLLAEQREVCEFLFHFLVAHLEFFGCVRVLVFLDALPLGQNLVGRDGYRADFLDFAGVFLYHVYGEVSLVADFADPLAACRNVRCQDEGFSLYQSHRGKANHRLARTARQHDYARTAFLGTARIENLCRFFLVVAEVEFLSAEGSLAQVDGERVAHGVTREVLDREPGVGERHLDVAAALAVHNGVRVVDEFLHVLGDFGQLADFDEHDLVVGFHDEVAAIVHLEAQQAVAGHVVLDFGNDALRDGVAALAFEAFQHVGCAESGRCGVPKAQVRYLVCMQVLGALDQFGEGSNRVSCRFVGGGIDLDHDFEVALNNNGAIRIHRAPNIVKKAFFG